MDFYGLEKKMNYSFALLPNASSGATVAYLPSFSVSETEVRQFYQKIGCFIDLYPFNLMER